MTKAAHVLRNICTAGLSFQSVEAGIVPMLVVAVASHVLRNRWNMEERYIRLPAPVQALGYSCAIIVIFLFFTTEQRFIYFQF